MYIFTGPTCRLVPRINLKLIKYYINSCVCISSLIQIGLLLSKKEQGKETSQRKRKEKRERREREARKRESEKERKRERGKERERGKRESEKGESQIEMLTSLETLRSLLAEVEEIGRAS